MYQAGAVLRAGSILKAYHTCSWTDYHDAIMPLHSFVYARSFFFILGTIGPTENFVKNVNSKYVYMAAITGGALISVGHCINPWSMSAYVALVHAIGKLNTWTRRKIDLQRFELSTLQEL
jgi:predicted membrane channel-forming protein YqfA (hemolysin III family)